MQEKLNDMMRRDDELDKDEAMKKREIGKFGKIQQKVNKKFGNVEIKAYFCTLNKYITLKNKKIMAIEFKTIPVLHGEAAARFVEAADEALEKRGSIDFSKQVAKARAILKRTKLYT